MMENFGSVYKIILKAKNLEDTVWTDFKVTPHNIISVIYIPSHNSFPETLEGTVTCL